MPKTQHAAALAMAVHCALSIGLRTGRAEDWPQWRGPHRDGRAPALKTPAAWPGKLTKVWSAAVGEGHASPVVAGNRVLQFSRLDERETLTCYDLAGKQLWRRDYAAPYKMNSAAEGHGKGPKSTPLVVGDVVVTLGISGTLSGWSLADGARLWQHDFANAFRQTSPLFGAAMSPLEIDGAALVHVGGHDSGGLATFDCRTGKLLRRWSDEGPAYTSPIRAALAGRPQIVTQTQTRAAAFSLQGEPLWSFPYETQYVQNIVTPIVHGELVVFSGYNRGMTGYRVAADGGALSAKQAWHNDDVSLYMSSPVLSGGRLYGFSQYKKGQLFALNPATGETAWTGPGRQGDNALLIAAGDALLALTTEGELIVFADAAEYRELARYPVADSPTWAHPAAVSDGLLLKDARELSRWRWE